MHMKNPRGYLTDMINEDYEFPLELEVELLAQKGATEQWFEHQWTIRYARAYLSKWGNQHHTKHPNALIANNYQKVFPLASTEASNPMFTQCVRTTSAEGSSGEGLRRDAQKTSQATTRE